MEAVTNILSQGVGKKAKKEMDKIASDGGSVVATIISEASPSRKKRNNKKTSDASGILDSILKR